MSQHETRRSVLPEVDKDLCDTCWLLKAQRKVYLPLQKQKNHLYDTPADKSEFKTSSHYLRRISEMEFIACSAEKKSLNKKYDTILYLIFRLHYFNA